MKLHFLSNRFCLIILAAVIFSSSLNAQNHYNLSQFGDESIQFIKQPVKWEGDDWLKFGAVTASTFLISLADQHIRDAVLKDPSFISTLPEKVGRFWGKTYTTAIFAGVFGLHGIITNDPSTKKIGYEIVQTTIYAGAITQFLKIAFGRARPETEKGSSSFHPFSTLKDNFFSFPSGDVTLAFSLSSVLANNSKSDLVKIICYTPAVLTMASRVYQDRHWSSDVFFGAAVGYFVGNWVSSLHEEKNVSIQSSLAYPLMIKVKL